MRPDDFSNISTEKLQAALDAMFRGDFPYCTSSLWSHADDVSLLGAWGPCKVGWAVVEPTLRWAWSRFKEGNLRYEGLVADASVDVGHTVGYEKGEVKTEDGAMKPIPSG